MARLLLNVVNDKRTPLEKSLGVDPRTVAARGETARETQLRNAKAALLKHGMRVIELPSGKWHVVPEYPAKATDADKAVIDRACEDWMRRIAGRK